MRNSTPGRKHKRQASRLDRIAAQIGALKEIVLQGGLLISLILIFAVICVHHYSGLVKTIHSEFPAAALPASADLRPRHEVAAGMLGCAQPALFRRRRSSRTMAETDIWQWTASRWLVLLPALPPAS